MSPNTSIISNKQFLWSGFKVLFVIAFSTLIIFATYLWFPANLHYRVSEKYTFYSWEDSGLVSLGVVLPKTGPYQLVKDIVVTWPGLQERIEKPNVELLKLTIDIEPGEIKEALIEYQVILPQGKESWDAPRLASQLSPKRGFDIDHPIILELVSQVYEKGVEKSALDIYNFTVQYLERPIRAEEISSFSYYEAYLLGIGNCLESARLLVTLYMATGIHSRVIVGNTMPDIPLGSTEIILADEYWGHAWVEVTSGDRWTLADPSWAAEFPQASQFGRNDGRHLSFGEIIQEQLAFYEIYFWAADNGTLIDAKNAYLRYAASGPGGTSFQAGGEIKMIWDGRLMNAVIVWLIVTFLVYKFRKYIIS